LKTLAGRAVVVVVAEQLSRMVVPFFVESQPIVPIINIATLELPSVET
jgi:hypothetical protein|tara:strand:- start:2935 stop:3078 length:144 start_codon:yes stop_codon:yes gene_type:complete